MGPACWVSDVVEGGVHDVNMPLERYFTSWLFGSFLASLFVSLSPMIFV